MKKLILPLVFFFTAFIGVNAQNVDRIIALFQNEENVSVVNLPKSLIQFGLKLSDDAESKELLQKIDKVQILSLEGASPTVKSRFATAVKTLNTDGYDVMLHTKEKGEQAKILTKVSGNAIKSMLIVALDDADCSLIRIDGDIRPDELDAVINGVSKASKKQMDENKDKK